VSGKEAAAGGASGVGAPLSVLVVAASRGILGGQAVQAERLIEGLREEPSLEVGFLPINPRWPGLLGRMQRVKYVRTVLTMLLYLASLVARVRRYDVIHVFSASYFSFVLAPTPAILVARLYGKRVLLNYHSGEAADHLARWRRTALPTLRLADSIVVPSGYLVEVFARFGLRARAVFNHVEPGEGSARERVPLRPVFLANRNFEPHYGVDTVLRAFALIQERHPDASLTVAGDGGQRAALERLARELGLRNVEFTGQVAPERMRGLYDAADIYLNGSTVDNMPLSILEAYAAGLAVVTTDAGGIPYIVRDGETGLLAPAGDHAALAARALALLDDAGLAARVIAGARAEVGRYSWASVRDEWLKVYRELAPNARRAVAAAEDDHGGERLADGGTTAAAGR
jgi:glycosyltransferase involved in cell wall biosynthesis